MWIKLIASDAWFNSSCLQDKIVMIWFKHGSSEIFWINDHSEVLGDLYALRELPHCQPFPAPLSSVFLSWFNT